MIRSELLQALSADNPELRPEEVEQVVDIFFDEIAARLAEGAGSSCAASGPSRPGCATRALGAIRAPASRSKCRRSECPTSSPARKCASGSTPIELAPR
jgi:hypothetical protein